MKGGALVFQVRQLAIDTLSEHVAFVHRDAVRKGGLGLKPLDRVRVVGDDAAGRRRHEITAVLNFTSDRLVSADEVGLSAVAFEDLGLPEGARVHATLSPAPASLDRGARGKLRGERLALADFEAILEDVVGHRYSKVELTMFVLSCALQHLDVAEGGGAHPSDDSYRSLPRLRRGGRSRTSTAWVASPGNRTTMIRGYRFLAALGLRVPKTSSRAITSPAGTRGHHGGSWPMSRSRREGSRQSSKRQGRVLPGEVRSDWRQPTTC